MYSYFLAIFLFLVFSHDVRLVVGNNFYSYISEKFKVKNQVHFFLIFFVRYIQKLITLGPQL